MKRILASILVCLLVVSLAACGSKAKTEETEETLNLPAEVQTKVDELLADMTGGEGGWESQDGKAVSQKAREAFAKAAEQELSEGYTMVSLLGTQVVSGTNYCFLCQSSANEKYQVVYVYENLDGEAEITDVLDLQPGE